MGAADPGGPGPDLYQLLGVPRSASREDILQAWRREARTGHPDSRPGDATAPARFRAVAGAWHVLGNPARRAAYDQALTRGQIPAPVSRPPEPAAGPPTARMPGSPPLWAGPVWVEVPPGAPAPGRLDDEEDVSFAVVAELAFRYLARARDWPW